MNLHRSDARSLVQGLAQSFTSDAVDVADFGPAPPIELWLGMDLFAFNDRDLVLIVIGIAIALGAIRVGAHDRGVYHLC